MPAERIVAKGWDGHGAAREPVVRILVDEAMRSLLHWLDPGGGLRRRVEMATWKVMLATGMHTRDVAAVILGERHPAEGDS